MSGPNLAPHVPRVLPSPSGMDKTAKLLEILARCGRFTAVGLHGALLRGSNPKLNAAVANLLGEEHYAFLNQPEGLQLVMDFLELLEGRQAGNLVLRASQPLRLVWEVSETADAETLADGLRDQRLFEQKITDFSALIEAYGNACRNHATTEEYPQVTEFHDEVKRTQANLLNAYRVAVADQVCTSGVAS